MGQPANPALYENPVKLYLSITSAGVCLYVGNSFIAGEVQRR